MRYPPFRRARNQPLLGLISNHQLNWWLVTYNIKKCFKYEIVAVNMTMTDVKIWVPDGMVSYIITNDAQSELTRNAMLLYPYIKDLNISHGKAAEILGIRKYELIDLYGKLGLPYLDQDINEIDKELQYWKEMKGAVV